MTADRPIWDDPDVKRIYQLQDGVPYPMFHVFNDEPQQLELIRDWVTADQAIDADAPAGTFIQACLTGIRAVEGLAGSVDPGWLKFVVYRVEVDNLYLWELHQRRTEAAAIAEWVVATIENFGWGPDGNASPLGQRHSNAMAVAAAAGGGLRMNPATGQFEYGNGDDARRAAKDGRFR
jgi:hypothetical protein